MEILHLALLALIIYLMLTNKNTLTTQIQQLEFRISELQRMLKESLEHRHLAEEIKPQKTKIQEEIPDLKQEEAPSAPFISIEEHDERVEEPHEIVRERTPIINTPIKTLHSKESDEQPHFQPDAQPKPQFVPQEPQLSFFERHPDLEKFIGENLINKIGIAILVLAIGFFVKYAIDNDWVGPAGRVGIGILCGGILIGVAHRLRNTYQAFSSVLVGGGLAIFYFTITLAFHEFHLFNQTASFIILIVITCFAVALSLLYDRQELAVIALVGGLASPFMVSTGHANYHALFIYLVILNGGLLIIAYNKSWRILNSVAFGLTTIICIGVVYSLSALTYSTGFLYISILYLMFFAINVANNVRENKKFIASDFTILLINTALYFAAGLYLLTEMGQGQYRGLFSASLGIVNLLLSYLLFRNKKVDANILYLLIGITLTFISLTAPIQLHGHNITLFWAAEAVLLYWLYQKSNIALMKFTSLMVWCAMLISLFMDWGSMYSSYALNFPIIANRGFITTLVTAISSALMYTLASRTENAKVYGITINVDIYKYAAFLLLFLSGALEINHQFLNHYPDTDLNGLYLMVYTPVFIFVLFLLSKKFPVVQLNWKIAAVLIPVCILYYLIQYPDVYDIQDNILNNRGLSGSHFIAHWISAIFIGLLFYQLVLLIKNNVSEGFVKLSTWVLSATIVLFLSFEFNLLGNFIFYSKTNGLAHIQTIYIKTVLPILWGVLSFAMMWLGMRNKNSTLRIISLVLFSITLIKLFMFDIRNIPAAGKIAAFFILGVILLVISFMYQKVKKIIIEDENKPKE